MIPEVFECPRCERQFVIDSVPDTGSEEVHCPQCSRFLGVRDIAFVLRSELDEGGAAARQMLIQAAAN